MAKVVGIWDCFGTAGVGFDSFACSVNAHGLFYRFASSAFMTIQHGRVKPKIPISHTAWLGLARRVCIAVSSMEILDLEAFGHLPSGICFVNLCAE